VERLGHCEDIRRLGTPLNTSMIWRVALILVLLTATALALHENTFAVFELKEELQMRYMNMWELFQQLEYVTAEQREVVYEEIQHLKSEITRIIDQLILLDKAEH
jgi:predicted Holliday junction resolvase-like endonuclease